MQGHIALAVCMSGIAALLLPGGRTAHSRFRLPVPVPLDHCSCNVSARSAAARVLREAAVIVWDEAPTVIRSMMQAVDALLQELMSSTRPFGGKPILLGGDWRQIPPVLKYVDRDAVLCHIIAALPWWQAGRFRLFQLKENMRAREDKPYADFCLSVGEGRLKLDAVRTQDLSLSAAAVSLPSALSAPAGTTASELLAWVYDGFESIAPAGWPQFYASRSVLAPTNSACDDLNACMFDLLDAATEHISYSKDCQLSDVDSAHLYPQEFLNGVNPSGMPPHELRLRRGTLIILLRNYAPLKGLCNGTRLVVDSGPVDGNSISDH